MKSVVLRVLADEVDLVQLRPVGGSSERGGDPQSPYVVVVLFAPELVDLGLPWIAVGRP